MTTRIIRKIIIDLRTIIITTMEILIIRIITIDDSIIMITMETITIRRNNSTQVEVGIIIIMKREEISIEMNSNQSLCL